MNYCAKSKKKGLCKLENKDQIEAEVIEDLVIGGFNEDEIEE